MKKILLASTAMRCLLRRGNEKTHYSYNSKRKVNDKAGGRLVVAGMVSLGLWAMADPAVAVGGRDLLTNLNGKEEHNSGDRLPISLPNDYYTDNKNNISNHHPRQLALVTIDHIRGAKQPVKEQAPAVSAPAPQQQQVDKQQQTVKKQQAGQQQQTVKKQQAGQQQQTVKKILPLKQQQGAQKRVLVNNAADGNANKADAVVNNDLVVTSAVKLITPPVNTGMSRNGFYIRPEGEAILTYGTFTNDGKMGIGAGGSVFMGYRYAPNGLSAGHLGFELGGGFFMPRVDKANSAVGAPSIFGENVATAMAFGADTNRDVGGLSFGNKTNMVSRSDVVTGSFVNGLTQATTRSDAGLVAVSSANGLTVMISQGMTQAVLDSRLNVVVTNSQNMSFFNATGKTIGVTSSQVVSNFQKSDISSSLAFYGSVQGAVTSTLVWGVTMTEGAAVQGRFPSGTYVFLGGDYRNQVLTAPGDSPYSHTIAANSSGTIVIGNVVTGAPVTITSSIIPWSSDLVAIGVTAPNTPLISSFQATPVIGHLAGSPTLAISDFNVYQSVKTYITGVRRDETYQVSDTRVIDTTTGFNISETVAVKVHLNKTETAASKQVTETTVVDYDRVALPSASANKRVIADSKENYIPITVGINYSLPMGNSGFGFTMGVDAGAWVHNISRSYYFMGGNAPTYHFTETTISHYSDNKTIFNYAMGSGSVAVNQTATEMKEHFNSHDIQTLNFTQQGSVSMLYNVPLEAYKTFVYNSNTNAILFGYINPTNSALPTSTILYPQSGNGNEYPIINFDNSSHPFYNANSSYLQEIKPGTINLSGLIYLGHVIFLDGKTPTFTTVAISSLSTVPMYYFNAIGSSNISGTFTSSTLAVSHLSTTGFGTGTITSGRTVAVGISAVITSTAAVAAGGSVTTLLGSNVALANNSFTTETATVRMLGSSSTSIISSVNGVAVGAVNTVIKMDQAMQVKGVIIPKISFNWSPLDNLTFTLGGKVYIVIGGYSDYYSAEARAEAAARGIGYKKDELLWYGGLNVGAQFTF